MLPVHGFGAILALLGLVCASPLDLQERQPQLVCPAGYTTASAQCSAQTILCPVQIDFYFPTNTVLDIKGYIVNVTGAPTHLFTHFTATTTTLLNAGFNGYTGVAAPGISGGAGDPSNPTGPGAQPGGVPTGGISSLSGNSATASPGAVGSSVTSSAISGSSANAGAGNGDGSSAAVTLSLSTSIAAIASTTISSSPANAATAAPQFLLSFNTPSLKKRQERQRLPRQAFLGHDGSLVSSCSQAARLTFDDGQLLINGDQYSTNPGVNSQVFAPINPPGNITRGFSGPTDFAWSDARFGHAVFCVQDDMVYSYFTLPVPPACRQSVVEAWPASRCQDGSLVSSDPVLGPSSTSSLPSTLTSVHSGDWSNSIDDPTTTIVSPSLSQGSDDLLSRTSSSSSSGISPAVPSNPGGGIHPSRTSSSTSESSNSVSSTITLLPGSVSTSFSTISSTNTGSLSSTLSDPGSGSTETSEVSTETSVRESGSSTSSVSSDSSTLTDDPITISSESSVSSDLSTSTEELSTTSAELSTSTDATSTIDTSTTPSSSTSEASSTASACSSDQASEMATRLTQLQRPAQDVLGEVPAEEFQSSELSGSLLEYDEAIRYDAECGSSLDSRSLIRRSTLDPRFYDCVPPDTTLAPKSFVACIIYAAAPDPAELAVIEADVNQVYNNMNALNGRYPFPFADLNVQLPIFKFMEIACGYPDAAQSVTALNTVFNDLGRPDPQAQCVTGVTTCPESSEEQDQAIQLALSIVGVSPRTFLNSIPVTEMISDQLIGGLETLSAALEVVASCQLADSAVPFKLCTNSSSTPETFVSCILRTNAQIASHSDDYAATTIYVTKIKNDLSQLANTILVPLTQYPGAVKTLPLIDYASAACSYYTSWSGFSYDVRGDINSLLDYLWSSDTRVACSDNSNNCGLSADQIQEYKATLEGAWLVSAEEFLDQVSVANAQYPALAGPLLALDTAMYNAYQCGFTISKPITSSFFSCSPSVSLASRSTFYFMACILQNNAFPDEVATQAQITVISNDLVSLYSRIIDLEGGLLPPSTYPWLEDSLSIPDWVSLACGTISLYNIATTGPQDALSRVYTDLGDDSQVGCAEPPRCALTDAEQAQWTTILNSIIGVTPEVLLSKATLSDLESTTLTGQLPTILSALQAASVCVSLADRIPSSMLSCPNIPSASDPVVFMSCLLNANSAVNPGVPAVTAQMLKCRGDLTAFWNTPLLAGQISGLSFPQIAVSTLLTGLLGAPLTPFKTDLQALYLLLGASIPATSSVRVASSTTVSSSSSTSASLSTTTSPTATGTTAVIPDGWTLLGCYNDADYVSSFTGHSASLTVESCLQHCLSLRLQSSGDMVYGAVSEYLTGDATQEGWCRCGPIAEVNSLSPVDDALCNWPCSGNTHELCGGAGYDFVYSNVSSQTTTTSSLASTSTNPSDPNSTSTSDPSTTTTDAPTSTTSTPPAATTAEFANWQLLGCFQTVTDYGSLDAWGETDLVPETCAAACLARGYAAQANPLVAAMGDDYNNPTCYCMAHAGRGQSGTTRVDDSLCEGLCTTDQGQFCGGAHWAIFYEFLGPYPTLSSSSSSTIASTTTEDVSSTATSTSTATKTATPSPQAAWEYVGCYGNSAKGSAAFQNNSPLRTIENCEAMCLSQIGDSTTQAPVYAFLYGNMMAMGLSQQCACAAQIDSTGVKIDDSYCTVACADDGSEICGGMDAGAVYHYIGYDLPASASPTSTSTIIESDSTKTTSSASKETNSCVSLLQTDQPYFDAMLSPPSTLLSTDGITLTTLSSSSFSGTLQAMLRAIGHITICSPSLPDYNSYPQFSSCNIGDNVANGISFVACLLVGNSAADPQPAWSTIKGDLSSVYDTANTLVNDADYSSTISSGMSVIAIQKQVEAVSVNDAAALTEGLNALYVDLGYDASGSSANKGSTGVTTPSSSTVTATDDPKPTITSTPTSSTTITTNGKDTPTTTTSTTSSSPSSTPYDTTRCSNADIKQTDYTLTSPLSPLSSSSAVTFFSLFPVSSISTSSPLSGTTLDFYNAVLDDQYCSFNRLTSFAQSCPSSSGSDSYTFIACVLSAQLSGKVTAASIKSQLVQTTQAVENYYESVTAKNGTLPDGLKGPDTDTFPLLAKFSQDSTFVGLWNSLVAIL